MRKNESDVTVSSDCDTGYFFPPSAIKALCECMNCRAQAAARSIDSEGQCAVPQRDEAAPLTADNRPSDVPIFSVRDGTIGFVCLSKGRATASVQSACWVNGFDSNPCPTDSIYLSFGKHAHTLTDDKRTRGMPVMENVELNFKETGEKRPFCFRVMFPLITLSFSATYRLNL